MSFTRISAIVLRQYYLIKDNPTRTAQLFVWSFLEITLWGFVSQYVASEAGVRFEFVFLGAIVLWEFLIRVMYGLTMTFFEDVWSRNFLNMFASPLSLTEYLAGMVLSSIATTTVSFAAVLAFSWMLFGFSIAMYGLAALPFLFVLFLSGVALGIFGVALVLRFGPSAEWFIWPLPAVVSPFAGVFYPIETLPQWVQYISVWLPPTYVFDGVRSIAMGGVFDATAFLKGSALACIAIALAYAYFYSVYRRAIRTGLIARYSAETVA
jgi:ABC-2 type transport system permease protein